MEELRHFSLTQLKQLLYGNNDRLANNYISQNLAVARHVDVSLIKEQFLQVPLLMPEMRVLVLKHGSAETVVNLTPRHIEAGDLIFAGPQTIIQLQRASDDAAGLGLSMSDDLFSLAVGSRIPKAFDGRLRDFQLHLEPHDRDFLESIHHLLYVNMSEEDHSPQVTLSLINAFLCYVDFLWSRHEEVSRQEQSREQRLFSEFMQLVSQYAPQEHNIDFYADRLFLSPRYVSTIVKRVSGRSAKEWIDDAIVTRIKVELRHTDKPLSQISDEMNFPDSSFFSKFFKRVTGLRPMEFKQRKSC